MAGIVNTVYFYHCTFKFQVFFFINFVAYLPTDFTICLLVFLILVVILLVSNGQLLIVVASCLKGLLSTTVLWDRFRSVTRGYSLEWSIRGGSDRKGYLFQASGIQKGKDFTR